jgi:hypothetical protein
MKRPRRSPKRTAHHEAGHAVIGRVLTLVCGYATIVPNYAENESGHSIAEDPLICCSEWERRGKVRADNAEYHARLITFMAGKEAADICLGKGDDGDGDDRDQIALMMEEITADDPARLEARLRKFTRMLVRRHRSLIERVAKALMRHNRLSRSALDRMCGNRLDRMVPNTPLT